jgi:hypothetical protein
MASQYDIYTQVIPAAAYTGTKFFSFGPTRSLSVRGMQKLVGIFAKYLLTPIGSDPLDPLGGTQLPSLLGSNVGVSDAHEILLLSVEKTVKAIQAFQSGVVVADDERLATAQVTKFIHIPEAPGFAAQIFIENIIDQGISFLLPSLTSQG